MPGGLEGRLLREQIKAQRLQNAGAAMNLARPAGMIQEGLGLAEMARLQANSRASDAQTSVLDQERQRMAFQNMNAQDDRSEERKRAALQQAIMTLQSGGGDKTNVMNDLLSQLGFTSQVVPQDSGFGLAEDTAEREQAMAMLSQMMESLNKPQPQPQP